MDSKEHLLLVKLLTQQNLFLKQICDALESEGVLKGSDIRLFGDYLLVDKKILGQMQNRTLEHYLDTAKQLGVQTGLEGLATKPEGLEEK